MTTVMLHGIPGSSSESEWPSGAKILPSGTLHKKSLPTLVTLNDFLNATMPVLSKLLYITKCYTCVWFELMRLVETVIADVLSKNNKKIFSNDIWKFMSYICCCWKKGMI